MEALFSLLFAGEGLFEAVPRGLSCDGLPRPRTGSNFEDVSSGDDREILRDRFFPSRDLLTSGAACTLDGKPITEGLLFRAV